MDKASGKSYKQIAEEIDAKLPDNKYYGRLLEGLDTLNEKMGYQVFSGSIADGSFSINARRKKFDLDVLYLMRYKIDASSAVEVIKPIEENQLFAKLDFTDIDKDKLHRVDNYTKTTEPDSDGRCYLSAEAMRKHHDLTVEIILEMTEDVRKRDTPKVAVNYDWANKLNIPSYITADVVPAVYCEGWPQVAVPFLSRIEKKKWPPAGTADELTNRGYYMVPKSRRDGNAELEWRLSFSAAEAYLAKVCTPFQRRCFSVFKLITKTLLGEEGKEEKQILKSYHLKMVCYWEFEQNPELWEREDLGECISLLFDRLRKCLQDTEIKFYFIDDVNLLELCPADERMILGEYQEKIKMFRRTYEMPDMPLLPAEVDNDMVAIIRNFGNSLAAKFLNDAGNLVINRFLTIPHPESEVPNPHEKFAKEKAIVFARRLTAEIVKLFTNALLSEHDIIPEDDLLPVLNANPDEFTCKLQSVANKYRLLLGELNVADYTKLLEDPIKLYFREYHIVSFRGKDENTNTRRAIKSLRKTETNN